MLCEPDTSPSVNQRPSAACRYAQLASYSRLPVTSALSGPLLERGASERSPCGTQRHVSRAETIHLGPSRSRRDPGEPWMWADKEARRFCALYNRSMGNNMSLSREAIFIEKAADYRLKRNAGGWTMGCLEGAVEGGAVVQ